MIMGCINTEHSIHYTVYTVLTHEPPASCLLFSNFLGEIYKFLWLVVKHIARPIWIDHVSEKSKTNQEKRDSVCIRWPEMRYTEALRSRITWLNWKLSQKYLSLILPIDRRWKMGERKRENEWERERERKWKKAKERTKKFVSKKYIDIRFHSTKSVDCENQISNFLVFRHRSPLPPLPSSFAPNMSIASDTVLHQLIEGHPVNISKITESLTKSEIC